METCHRDAAFSHLLTLYAEPSWLREGRSGPLAWTRPAVLKGAEMRRTPLDPRRAAHTRTVREAAQRMGQVGLKENLSLGADVLEGPPR